MALSRRVQEICITIAILFSLLVAGGFVVRREHQRQAERAKRAAVLEMIRHPDFAHADPRYIQEQQQYLVANEERLKRDPNNSHIMRGMAEMYSSLKMWDEAKRWFRKAIETGPNIPDNYSALGMTHEILTRYSLEQGTSKLGIQRQQLIEDMEICDAFRSKNGTDIDEGIAALQKALELRPKDTIARQELERLWETKADVECGNPAARAADLKKREEVANGPDAVQRK